MQPFSVHAYVVLAVQPVFCSKCSQQLQVLQVLCKHSLQYICTSASSAILACRDWYNFLGIQAALPADLKDQLTQAPGTLSQVCPRHAAPGTEGST